MSKRVSLALTLVVGFFLALGCGDDDDKPPSASGGTAGQGGAFGPGGDAGSSTRAGTTSAGAGGTRAPVGGGGGSAPSSSGGAGQAGSGGAVTDAGAGGSPTLGPCGDPAGRGVLLDQDVSVSTTWSCPLYTLTKPIFVYSDTSTRTKLTIAPGTVIRGVAGIPAKKLPGALVISRTGMLEAVGAPAFPIVFTSEKPAGERAPGDWGGVVLLGRAPTNVPDNLESFENPVAGEMYIEGLPPSDKILYGAPILDNAAGAGGSNGAASGGAAGDAGAGGRADSGAGGGSAEPVFVNTGDPGWSCGRLEYVRIEFPGFEVASQRELNGLTLGACGSGTVIDHVQVHKSSDDGIELFGGSVDLKHIVLTGMKDDALDWDQGYRGRLQFVAIQMHDDSLLSEGKGDNGIEADGYAALNRTFDRPSNARIYNMTLIASATTLRGARLREGTQVTIRNSLLLAAPHGAPEGLIDLGDAATADFVTSGDLLVENSLFFGPWPASGQADSAGTLYIEADHFLRDLGELRNREAPALDAVLPDALDEAHPGWVPPLSSLAAEGAAALDPDPFYQEDARYLGAFEPGGVDWSEGWTAYPEQ